MLDTAKYIMAFGLAAIIALALTPVVMHLATALGMIDQPGERRIHTKPTPRGGGLAVFAAFHLSCIAVLPFAQSSLGSGWWVDVFWASLILLVVGLVDDKWGLRPFLKLAGQLTAALVFIQLNGSGFNALLGWELPPLLDKALTVFWLLALTNAFNLIDGLDGLAAGLAAIAATGLALMFFVTRRTTDALVPFALAGACIGFLRYNFSPARVFLGDAGSLMLGFTLGAITLATATKSTFLLALGIPLLAFGVPVLDTLLAVWRRSLRALFPRAFNLLGSRGHIMTADRLHLHHRILGAGFKQHHVALILYAVNAALVAIGLLALTLRSRAPGVLLLAFLLLLFVGLRLLVRAELWDTGRVIVHGLRRPGIRSIAGIAYPAWDLFCIMAACLAAALIEYGFSREFRPKLLWLNALPVWAAPTIILLVLFRVYQRVWSMAALMDYAWLAAGVFAGSCAGLALDLVLRGAEPQVSVLQAVGFGSVAMVGVFGGRIGLRLLEEGMALLLHGLGGAHETARVPAVVLGADRTLLLYLRDLWGRHGEDPPSYRIVGIVSTDPNLRDRRVSGLPVLGLMENLRTIVAERGIRRIVVAMPLTPDQEAALFETARQEGAEISRWVNREEPVPVPPATAAGDFPAA